MVIISPYIQTSTNLIDLLKKAEEKGVETTIVYKEQEVKDFEKNKLKNIDNLNLLHHPNIHCKLYYNEKYLIICSMNLYDYSQRNNREMVILLRRTDEDSTGWNDRMFNKDDDGIFQDAIAEIKSIINGSEFEKDSRETRTIGFEMDISKTNYDLTLECCHKYNQYSKNKKFIPFQSGEEWYCKCENFLDNVDLVFENGKAKINLNYEENRLQDIYQKLSTKSLDNDFRIVDCFRMFWTYHKSSISLYELKGNSVWEIKNSDEFHQKLFIGLNEVFKILKPVIQLTKN